MSYNKWRQKNHFRGPVIFGGAGSPIDATWYGDTTNSLIKFDASADEMYFDGCDLWLKDDDQLEFGDASDVVIDWDGSQLLFLPAAAAGKLTLGSSTYYMSADWNMSDVDIDLYGTNPDININRNLTSGATNAAVVYIKQDNTSDDQVALQVAQDAAVAGVDFDCGVDIDCPSTLNTGATVDIRRNLTSGATDQAVVYIKQDHTSDDQPVLKLDTDASDYLALDANGWCDIGYSTSNPSSSSVPTGAIRVLYVNSKHFIAIHTGSGTYKYVEIASTTTA